MATKKPLELVERAGNYRTILPPKGSTSYVNT
jgi:hypothetical protein